MDVESIREIILKPCQNVIKIPFDVLNYKNVIKMWKNYLRLDFIPQEIQEVKPIFDFHKFNNNHILLYSSKQSRNSLLMCKIKGKYHNILLPIEMNNYGNFVAIYA